MKHIRRPWNWLVVAAIILLNLGLPRIAAATPGTLVNSSDVLSTSVPSQTATNTISFTITDTSQPLGSIEFQFCQETSLPDDNPCTAPPGFSATGVTLTNQTGNTGFSVAGNSTANAIVLTRSPATPTTNPNTYTFSGITNPNVAESYFLRLYIYPTTDASGTETENAGLGLATANSVTVNSQVPPYLKFCTGLTISNFDCSTADGFTIDLGNLSSVQPKTGTSQFVVQTNAPSGYSVTANGTTLTSGNNVIANIVSPTPSLAGSAQFGINLRANSGLGLGGDPTGPGSGQPTTNYNIPNKFTYNDGDTIVSAPGVSDNQTFTVSYITNVPSNQQAGIYVTTITYICLANF